jgi:hypothetical protein
VKIELLVALISGAVALFSGALAVWGQFKSARLSAQLEEVRLAQQRRIESEKTLSRYREPLARAAYDLQSRFYNILEQGLIVAYFDNGGERERSYVVNNTAFLVAQYLAWTEIIRRDIQYINLGQDEQTRQLARLQDDIYALFQTDRFDRTFRVFAGEQRAIGERMIRDGTRGPECAGYGAFLDQLAKAPEPLLEPVRADVRILSTHLAPVRPRLVALQNALVDLLAFLDPDFIRFPKERRTKASGALQT